MRNTLRSATSARPARGGTTCEDDVSHDSFDIIKKYKIKDIQHKIFNELNKNIIFVFSDITYLNLYLNKNLNTPYNHEKIKTKIESLSTYREPNPTFLQTSKNLLAIENLTKIDLNKNIDGYYNIDKGLITNQHIIRNQYEFLLDIGSCYDYTKDKHESKPSRPLSGFRRSKPKSLTLVP